jgi:hypothetical protein
MQASVTTNGFPRSLSRQDSSEKTEWRALLLCASPRPDLDRLAGIVQHPFNWPLFLLGAEEHRVVPLVAASVNQLDHALIPPEVRDKLRELQRAQTLFALQLTAELFRLLERFAKRDIQVLITKGPALAVRCYGEPGMRQYGDLDLIVREADIRRSTEAMRELGYQPRVPLTAIDAKKEPGEYAFRKPGTHLLVEFHTERTFRYHPRRLQIEELFARGAFVTIDRCEVPTLSLEDELVLICVHGAKHFWERLMWIADVAALVSRQPLDWDRALAVANEVGAQRILRLGLRLAADLLGAELPAHLKSAVQSDRAVARLAAQIGSRLVFPELHEIGIVQRAAFRIQMRGSFFPGLAYLLRLSLTPTEEDWTPGKEGNRPPFIDAISRPFRLARKHGRPSSK